MSDQAEFIVENLPNLLIGFPGNRPGGLLMSVVLAVVGLGLGFLLGTGVAVLHDARLRGARWLARGFVQVIRGVPLILLLLLVHQLFGTGAVFGIVTTPLGSALVTLVLYSAAYQADIVHTGLLAVPSGLVDDARLLGCTPRRAYLTVRLPYSLRVMQPALTGQAITVFKDTSVVVVLGVTDLTTTARIALGSEVGNAPYWVATYLTVGVLYLVVALGVSLAARRAERRLGRTQLLDSLATVG